MKNRRTVVISRARLALRASPLWIAGLLMPTAMHAFDCANGLYVQASSLRRKPDSVSPNELISRARSAGVRRLFLYGQGIEGPSADVAEFISGARAAMGDVQVIVMLARKVCTSGTDAHCLDLDDGNARDRLAKQAALLWQQGYDGVQLDLEPVANDNGSLVSLLERVRSLKPSGKLLSIAGYSLELEGSIGRQLQRAPKGPGVLLTWSRGYYRQVLSHVDQVMVMNYDTALWDKGQYRDFTAWQVAQLLAIRPDAVEMQFGLPSSVAGRTGFFDRGAENLRSGVDGVRAGLAGRANCPSGFGVTIFTAQGMSPALWTEFSEGFATR